MFKRESGTPQLLMILLLAALIFSIAFNWGLPEASSPETTSGWPVDTIAPVPPLTEAYYRFTRAGTDPVIYPLLHYIVLDVAFGPYVVAQYLLGGLQSPSGDFPYGAVDPQQFFQSLTLIARIVSLVMALAIVVLVFDTTRRLFDRQAATWAALLAVLIAPLGYYAKTSNLDVPYLFWMWLAIHQMVLAVHTQRLRHYIAFAVAGAFAVATKDQAYGFLIALPLVLVFWHRRQTATTVTAGGLVHSAFSKPILITAASGVLAFALANNLLLGGLDGFLRHVDFADAFYEEHLADTDSGVFAKQLGLALHSSQLLLQLVGPATLMLVLLGCYYSVRGQRYMALATLLLPVVSYYLFVLSWVGLVYPRYLLGTTLLLMPFAGYGARQLLSNAPRKTLAVALVGLAIGWQALITLHLPLTLYGDSRKAMGDWIVQNVPAGSTIETQVQHRYLPKISDHASYALVGNTLDPVTYRDIPEQLTAAQLHERNPEYVLVTTNIGLTGDPATSGYDSVREYYRSLLSGELGYHVLAHFETRNLLPYRQIKAGLLPTTILLGRTELVESSKQTVPD